VLKDKVVLVNVWATWCPSCLYEHPYLVKLSQQGVVIVGVDYKDEPDKARQWLQEKGNPYLAVVDDRAGNFGLDLGVTGAPETYLIDRNGIVRWRYQGPIDERVIAPPPARCAGSAPGPQPRESLPGQCAPGPGRAR